MTRLTGLFAAGIKPAVIGIMVCLSAGACQFRPGPIHFSKTPYFFDAGGHGSEVPDGYYPLTPDTKYSEQNGYGWVGDGLKPFTRQEWKKSRDAFLIDGVSAKRVGFRADIPPGKWWLVLWFGAGMEDSSTTRLLVNGKNTTPALQAFTPDEEPRKVIQKTYRVIQQQVVIADSGLTFSLLGEQDSVRLMGFALIPDPGVPQNGELSSVLKKIKEAGRYDSRQKLEPIIQELNRLSAEKKEYRNFAAYWSLQLKLLQKAEKYFYYRGWSWATEKTGMGLFDHLYQSVMLYDGLLDRENPRENPLYERALWYRGRLLYWLWLERGIYFEHDAAARDLRKMAELHPRDSLVRMYNGEQIDTPDPFDGVKKPANAPAWAFSEWELMNRLKHIVDWWVLDRQSKTGEFGGKFGDDVELLRFWSPLILSGDTVAYQGWKKLADGVWNSDRMYKGYAKKPSDVEHSSEFLSDTAPLMVLYTDDPVYENRLSWSAGYFRNLWTGFNDKGYRFFKSSWFSSTEVEMQPPRNRDVPYTSRATKAVRYYAWKARDPETLKALQEWSDGWLHASQRTDKGKPLGIIPASVEYPTGAFNGDGSNWYTANMFWDYFDWTGGASILDQLLFTWTMTGQKKYLKPIVQNLQFVSKYAGSLSEKKNDFRKGSDKWAAYRLSHSSEFWSVIGTWRLLTGNKKYDRLLMQYGTPFIKYRLTGNPDYLVKGMEPYLKTIRYNYPMFTSEVIHTDRVHIAPGNTRQAGILQGMVTGYNIYEGSSPYIAVSWENASRDATFLVTNSDSSSLHVILYSFSKNNDKLTARLWQLRPGIYTMKITGRGKILESKKITIQKGGERFPILLPPHERIQLDITPISD